MKNWKRRWALFLAAALLALSLTGCGGSGEGPALSVCVGGAPEELDPIYATETADQTVLVHLYENLMRKTGDGSGGTTVTNGAAKSVSTEENADGTVTWTFKLRKAEWSDGRAVRAGDFVFAWQRLADPANDSPSASLLSVVAGYDAVRETGDVSLLQVTAEDDSTLVVVLNGKFDWFLTEVCTAPATMPLRQDLLQEETAAADGETAEAAAEPAEAAPWWNDLTGLVTNGPYQVSGYLQHPMSESRKLPAAQYDTIHHGAKHPAVRHQPPLLSGGREGVPALPQQQENTGGMGLQETLR